MPLSFIHPVFLVAPFGDEEAGPAEPSLKCSEPLSFGCDCTTKENTLSIYEMIDCSDHFSLGVGLRDMTIWYRNNCQDCL